MGLSVIGGTSPFEEIETLICCQTFGVGGGPEIVASAMLNREPNEITSTRTKSKHLYVFILGNENDNHLIIFSLHEKFMQVVWKTSKTPRI